MTLGHSDSFASSASQTMQTKKNSIFESGSEPGGMLDESGRSLDPNDDRVIVPSTPIAPKRACSSFILFSKAERANVKCEHPGASPAVMFKLLGERWRAADADTKAKYAALYAENKAKADDEWRVYAAASPAPTYKPTSAQCCITKSKPKKEKQPAAPNAPKRACSSFILFSKDERANVKREHPGASPALMFKLLGERWRAADADTKARYAALYAENKAKIEAVVVPLTSTSEVLGQPLADGSQSRTPKFETSSRSDDASQWCDGYSRPIPIEPESSEYPRLLWKLRV